MSKKKTTAQFVEEAKQTHGDRYDYSFSECNGYSKKTKIICKLHGAFEQKITHHIDGRGCPQCGQISSKLSNQKDDKWDYEKLKEFYPKESLESCSQIFGKSIKTVHKKVKLLGLRIKHHEFIPPFLMNNLKIGAETRGLEMKIGYAEIWDTFILQNRKCALTGWDITFAKTHHKNTASVDRIDSRLGYTKNNIQIVHKLINVLKQNYDEEFLFRVAEAIYRHNIGKYETRDIVWEDDLVNDTIKPVYIEKPINFNKAKQEREKIAI